MFSSLSLVSVFRRTEDKDSSLVLLCPTFGLSRGSLVLVFFLLIGVLKDVALERGVFMLDTGNHENHENRPIE